MSHRAQRGDSPCFNPHAARAARKLPPPSARCRSRRACGPSRRRFASVTRSLAPAHGPAAPRSARSRTTCCGPSSSAAGGLSVKGVKLLCGGKAVLRALDRLNRQGQQFELRQVPHRVFLPVSTHLHRRHQLQAHCRPARQSKDPAAIRVIELDAAHTGRLASGHAGNRGADRRRRATGATAGTAVHRCQ